MAAGVFTLLIFALGVALGIIMDYQRLRWSSQANEQFDLDYKRLQFQTIYLTYIQNDNASCSVLYGSLDDAISDLDYSLDRVTQYEQESRLQKNQFTLIKRRYLLDNLKYWVLARETKRNCNLDVVTVLYFFSEENCPQCSDLGVVLTYHKKIYEQSLLVFPINVDLEKDEPVIELLRKRYQVYSLPAIVIEDQKYEGYYNRAQLGDIICSSFSNSRPECAD